MSPADHTKVQDDAIKTLAAFIGEVVDRDFPQWLDNRINRLVERTKAGPGDEQHKQETVDHYEAIRKLLTP